MEQVMTVKMMRERYGCSGKTAIRYIRQMVPHMENPVCAPMFAFHEWEESRMVYPEQISRKRKQELIKRKAGPVYVPRHR